MGGLCGGIFKIPDKRATKGSYISLRAPLKGARAPSREVQVPGRSAVAHIRAGLNYRNQNLENVQRDPYCNLKYTNVENHSTGISGQSPYRPFKALDGGFQVWGVGEWQEGFSLAWAGIGMRASDRIPL